MLGNVGGFGGMLFTRELCTDVALAVDRDGSGNLDLAEFLELVAKVLTVNKTLAMKGLHYDDHLQHLVNGGGTTAALPTTRSEVAIVDAATDGEIGSVGAVSSLASLPSSSSLHESGRTLLSPMSSSSLLQYVGFMGNAPAVVVANRRLRRDSMPDPRKIRSATKINNLVAESQDEALTLDDKENDDEHHPDVVPAASDNVFSAPNFKSLRLLCDRVVAMNDEMWQRHDADVADSSLKEGVGGGHGAVTSARWRLQEAFIQANRTALAANSPTDEVPQEEAAKDVKELPLSPFGNQVKSVKNHFSSRPESGTDLAQIDVRVFPWSFPPSPDGVSFGGVLRRGLTSQELMNAVAPAFHQLFVTGSLAVKLAPEMEPFEPCRRYLGPIPDYCFKTSTFGTGYYFE